MWWELYISGRESSSTVKDQKTKNRVLWSRKLSKKLWETSRTKGENFLNEEDNSITWKSDYKNLMNYNVHIYIYTANHYSTRK